MEQNKTHMKQLLREHNLRVTNNRLAVLDFLMQTAAPLSAEDIHQKFSKSINLVTIYRMLRQFVEAGILYQADFRDGKSYYEYQGANHHHHITCTRCGSHEPIDICVKQSAERAMKNSGSFATIKSHTLEFFGVCHDCDTQQV